MQGEVPPILVLELLHSIADTFKLYFGPEDATENKLRKNFAICFQLLEELLDDGYPFVTRENALTSAIAPPSWATAVASAVTGKSNVAGGIGRGLLSNTPWRTHGCKYVKYVDCFCFVFGSYHEIFISFISYIILFMDTLFLLCSLIFLSFFLHNIVMNYILISLKKLM